MAHSAPAATIADAINSTQQNVQEVHESAGEDLQAQMQRWAAEFPLLFSTDGPDSYVRNWSIPLQWTLTPIAAGVAASTQEDASSSIDSVWRSINAANDANVRGDVSAAQITAVINLFNDIWVAPP